MPYVVVAKRIKGRWAVVCPGCTKQHRHTGTGTKTAPCGTEYVILRPTRSTSVRAATMGTTPTDDGPTAA